jgi:hypothetical protein
MRSDDEKEPAVVIDHPDRNRPLSARRTVQKITAFNLSKFAGKQIEAVMGVLLHHELPFDEWQKLGQHLQAQTSKLAWAWGDWWLYGAHRYGERMQLVNGNKWHGPSFKTLANHASVCRKFETSRRREVLSFTHHQAVAALEPAVADQLLDLAQKRKWSAHVLRDRVAEITRPAASPPSPPAASPLPAPAPVPLPTPRPALRLDESLAVGPVPPELAELRVEPLEWAEPPSVDRAVEIARAAVRVLSDDQWEALKRAEDDERCRF